jgi:hypothetical protein
MPGRGYINTLKRTVTSQRTRRTRLIRYELQIIERRISWVGILHCLRKGVVARLLDAVEPFLGGVFAAIGIGGSRLGVFEYVLLVSLEDVSLPT